MATVREIIDIYRTRGDGVRYHGCTETDIKPYMSEEVAVQAGNLSQDRFGNGSSRHLHLANSVVFVGAGKEHCIYLSRDPILYELGFCLKLKRTYRPEYVEPDKCHD